MAKKAVAKKDEGALPAALMDQMDGYDGAGGEDASAQDMMIPYLTILQALSPQLNKQKGEFIQDAEQGEFFNSATNQTFSGEDGIMIIPVYYQRKYTEWVPRIDGGGLVGEHGPEILEQTTRSDIGKDVRLGDLGLAGRRDVNSRPFDGGVL